MRLGRSGATPRLRTGPGLPGSWYWGGLAGRKQC
jgi:hypothetical protein